MTKSLNNWKNNCTSENLQPETEPYNVSSTTKDNRWNNLIAVVHKPYNTIQFSNRHLPAYTNRMAVNCRYLTAIFHRETKHIIQLIEHKDKVSMPASWYRADPYGFPIQTLRALTIITQNKALSLTPAGQKYLIICSTVILCSVDGLSRWEPHTCLAKEGYYHNCLSREWRSGRVDRRDIFNPHASLSSLRTCKHTHTNPRHCRDFHESKESSTEYVCVRLLVYKLWKYKLDLSL